MKKRNMLYEKILIRKVIWAGMVIVICFLSLFGFLVIESNTANDNSFYEAMLCLCSITAIGATLSYLVLNEMRIARERKVIDIKVRDYYVYDHSELSSFEHHPLRITKFLNKVIVLFILFGLGVSFASLYYPDIEALRIVAASIGVLSLIILPIYIYNSAIVVERRYHYYKEKNRL